MKTFCSKRLGIALAVLNFSILFAEAANAQAPASIAGNTFGEEITSGTPPFASNGYYLFLPTNSTGYSVIGLGDIASSTGIYSYSAAGALGSISLFDSLAGFISGSYNFNTAFLGSDSLTDLFYGGSQSGDFVMFTNPVPNSINGQNYYANVQGGSGLFASSGAFILTTAASGNSYTITAISGGGINSSGTYSYAKLNASCGGIQLNDSILGISTVYVALSNSVFGGFYLSQPSTGNYQVGNVTILNSQAPASIGGNTFLSAVTFGTPPLATGGYFLFLPANSGKGYQIIGLGGVTNSSGTYLYSPSGAAGTINLTDSINGSINGNFIYYASLFGSYVLTAGTSGQYTQTGGFAMFTNPVPNSIAGQSFYITVTNGSYPFAASGSFNLTTAASGNSYTITAISGSLINSTGTYSYAKLNASCGGIQLTDSVMHGLAEAQRKAFEQHRLAEAKHEAAVAEWVKHDKRGAEPTPSQLSSFYIGDATLESVGVLLDTNPRGLLLMRDELSGWLDGFDKYSEGNEAAQWLEFHSGNAVRIDRKGGEKKTIYIPRALVSVTGTIQEPVLRNLLTGDDARHFDNGLAARFLMAMPPEIERHWREAVTPPDLAQQYADLFENLLALAPQIDAETGRRVPLTLTWAPEAKKRWIEFYNTHAKEMRAIKSDRLKSAWSKLEGQAARLALVFQCVREIYLPSPRENANTISADTLDAALVWIEWLKNETRRIYYTLTHKGDTRQGDKLIAFARRCGGSITARDAARAAAGGRDVEAVEKIMAGLVAAGFGEWHKPEQPKVGRPTRYFRLKAPPVQSEKATPCRETDKTPL